LDQVTKLIFDGVETKRFHTVPTWRQETVGHHQGIVMALLMHAYPRIRREVIRYASIHDLAEHVTGDAPSPTKRSHPDLKRLLDDFEDSVYRTFTVDLPILDGVEYNLFKRVDNVAGMMTCYREYMMGNFNITREFTNFRTYYDKLIVATAENVSLYADWMLIGNGILSSAVKTMAKTFGAPEAMYAGPYTAEIELGAKKRLLDEEAS